MQTMEFKIAFDVGTNSTIRQFLEWKKWQTRNSLFCRLLTKNACTLYNTFGIAVCDKSKNL